MSDDNLHVLLFAGRFEVRGSSAYTLRLAGNLEQQGVSVRLACIDATMIEPGKRSQFPIWEYRHLNFPLWGLVVREFMARDLADFRTDLIHIQSRSVLPQGDWLARRMQVPYVLTVHDYLKPREHLRFHPPLGRRVIAVSESVRSDLLSHIQLAREDVEVINSGVEVGTDPDGVPVLDPGHVPVVGAAGALEAEKGFPFFLGAAQRVLAERNDVQFLVAGAGPEEVNLRRMARELDIAGSVTFVPNLLDFKASLSAMDLFCLPALQQGLGTIMLEAMALGKPVIATGVGGVYSVLDDGQTGLVVPPSDAGQLAQNILKLLNDPVRARALGEAGRRCVRQHYTVEKMVSETAQLYRRVLEPSIAEVSTPT